MTKGTKFKLPSASKAGMQKKQGRNFLLPKEKSKRGVIPRPPKPIMPKPPVRPRSMREEGPAQIKLKSLSLKRPKPKSIMLKSPVRPKPVRSRLMREEGPAQRMSGPIGRTLSRTGITGPIGRTLTPKQRVEALKMKNKREKFLKLNRTLTPSQKLKRQEKMKNRKNENPNVPIGVTLTPSQKKKRFLKNKAARVIKK